MYKILILSILCILCVFCSSLFAQSLQWTYYDTLPNYDAQFGAQSVVYGQDGNIYSAGAVNFGIPRNEDFTVESFDSIGNLRWRYLYQGPGGHAEYANDICYGGDGNLYACGTSYGGPQIAWDFCTISLNTDGTQRWVNTINGPSNPPLNFDDEAYSIIYGGDGNIYAAGRIAPSYPNDPADAFVVSYTSAGVERWRYTYSGPSNEADLVYNIAYGADGNIYVAGSTGQGFGGEGADLLVISLSSSGVQRWVFTYNGPGDAWDSAHNIFVGTDGNIYAIGTTLQNDEVGDITVISLTPNGTQRWLYHYDGPSNYRDIGISGIWGQDGNIYVCGYSRSSTYDDAVVISITPSGSERWVYRYNDPTTNWREWFTCLTQGPNNDLYLAGYSYHGGTTWMYGDILVASVTNNGLERWVYRYAGPISNPGEDYASDIAYGNGCVYVAGRSVRNPDGYGRSFFVMSLKDTTLGIEELTGHTQKIKTLSATPNPFVNSTTIFGSRGRDLLIYDIVGHQVAKQKDSRVGNNLSAGVYFLKSEENSEDLIRIVKIK